MRGRTAPSTGLSACVLPPSGWGRASRGVRAGLRRAAGVRLAAGCDWRDYGSFQGLQPLVDAAEALFDGAHSRVKAFDTRAEFGSCRADFYLEVRDRGSRRSRVWRAGGAVADRVLPSRGQPHHARGWAIRIRPPRTVMTAGASSARRCRCGNSAIRAIRCSAGTSGRRSKPACWKSRRYTSYPKSVSIVTRILASEVARSSSARSPGSGPSWRDSRTSCPWARSKSATGGQCPRLLARLSGGVAAPRAPFLHVGSRAARGSRPCS